jgi:hypothetical protein
MMMFSSSNKGRIAFIFVAVMVACLVATRCFDGMAKVRCVALLYCLETLYFGDPGTASIHRINPLTHINVSSCRHPTALSTGGLRVVSRAPRNSETSRLALCKEFPLFQESLVVSVMP